MIEPEIAALLQPLERFEAIRGRAVRLGDRLCDLSYANPYGGVQEAARAAIRHTLDEDRLLDLQYTPFGGHTLIRRSVADRLTESHGLGFAYSDVVLTPGAMAALQLALRVSGAPGDEVVIPVPCWLDYPLYALSLGLTPVLVPLAPRTFDLNVTSIAAAITVRTCAVLISHPANPTGRNYIRVALAELAAALTEAESRHGCRVTLIADETHRDFTPEGEFESACTLNERTILVYSFGKYHFMQGQRIGYAAVSPRHPRRAEVAAELVRWTRITGIATPTSLMQRTVPKLLDLKHEQDWLLTWRARFLQELRAYGLTVVQPDATMFIYVQNPTPFEDFELVEALAAKGLLVLPAAVFNHAGFFRLSLTGSEYMLERALPILRDLVSS